MLCGSQVGDTGSIAGPAGSVSVSECAVAAGFVLHIGDVTGAVAVGDKVTSKASATPALLPPRRLRVHLPRLPLLIRSHVDQRDSPNRRVCCNGRSQHAF